MEQSRLRSVAQRPVYAALLNAYGVKRQGFGGVNLRHFFD